MAVRNLALEKNAIDKFVASRKTTPQTPADWAAVHKMAYPTLDVLPEELKANPGTLSYYQGTGAAKPAAPTLTPLNPMAQTVEGSDIDALAQAKKSAATRVEELSGGNEALRVLQEAVRAKTGVAQAPIGESKIFQQAGIGGYGALGQSLAARGNEINTNFANFKNIIGQMAGTYKDMADTAMFKYEASKDEYDAEVARLQKILDAQEAHKRELEILTQKDKLDKEMAALQHRYALEERATPTFGEKQKLYESGQTLDENGNIIMDTSGATADQIADAIAQHESGGRFGAKGGSGESGAFQFMPGTWNTISQQYAKANGINMSIPMTQENEDKVARWKIGQLVQQGYNARDIALIWNGSLGGSEKPIVKSGTNFAGQAYDTGKYANSVMNILQKKMKESGDTGSKFTPEWYSTPIGQKARDDERAMNNTFMGNQITKDYVAVQSQRDEMQRILDSGVGGPADLNMVYSFMKGLDPTSVVRESEYATAAKSGNIFSGWAAQFNGYLKEEGGFLPTKVKQGFLDLVKSKLAVKQKNYENYKKQVEATAKRQGLNPENVTLNLELPVDAGSADEMEKMWNENVK